MATGSIPLPPIGVAKLLHPDFFKPNRKLTGEVEIDWDNPLTRDLVTFVPILNTVIPIDLVTRKKLVSRFNNQDLSMIISKGSNSGSGEKVMGYDGVNSHYIFKDINSGITDQVTVALRGGMPNVDSTTEISFAIHYNGVSFRSSHIFGFITDGSGNSAAHMLLNENQAVTGPYIAGKFTDDLNSVSFTSSSDDVHKVFHEGDLVATDTTAALNLFSASQYHELGRNRKSFGLTEFGTGLISYVAVWNRSLSDTEAKIVSTQEGIYSLLKPKNSFLVVPQTVIVGGTSYNMDVLFNVMKQALYDARLSYNVLVGYNVRLTEQRSNTIDANNSILFNERKTDTLGNNISVRSDLSLNLKLSQTITAIITQNADVVFNSKLTDSRASQLDASGGMSLSTRQKIDLVTTLSANAGIIFNASYDYLTNRSLTVESDVFFNSRFTDAIGAIITQDVSVAFNIRQTQKENTQLVANPQLTLNQIRSLNNTASAEILAGVILNKKLSDNVAANLVVEQLLSLGLRQQLQQKTTLNAQADVVFNFINTLTIVEQALLSVGISLGSIQGITLDEGTSIAKIVTPEARTFIIRFEDRTLTVVKEVREIR